ncbi:MAG: fibro-slime domain-containing protein [Fibrobacter sp.]|nr:fibro-slime domain-containing protein [Fibrobacter sp.]
MMCGEKIVHIQVPWTSLYLNVNGTFLQVPETNREGDWYSFSLGGYGDQYAYQWFFAGSSDWSANKITSLDYNAPGDQNDQFTCTDFGVETEIYVHEDPTRPGKTITSSEPPGAKYFYFLPPDESEWFQGIAQMSINGGPPQNMEYDPNRCGWFRAVYFTSEPPENVVFTLDIDPDEFVIGENGTDDLIPVPINLQAKFEQFGDNVFFSADNGLGGWSGTDPGEERQCSYAMAALIYDTDASMHGAFTCDNYPNVATTGCFYHGLTWPGQTGIPCIGVTKGIVEEALGEGRKPVYRPESGCFESAEKFNQIFTETPGVNVKYCRDIQFERTPDGMWEFDSYNSPGKGFYPLEDVPDEGAGTKRDAYGGVLMGVGEGALALNNVNPEALLQYANAPAGFSWAAIDPNTGMPYIDSYPAQDGEFAEGKFPDVYNNMAWDACPNTDHPGLCREKHKKNQHFCFESHAEFVYRPGQRFFFRGDDDIWVFINNKLEVDLGGTHLAAPGSVILDDLGLVDGNTYPIDIFFCDRRTDMSNIRIKTNMYLEQKNSIFFVPNGNRTEIFGLQSGGGSCAALEQSTDTIKGVDMDISYWLLSTRGDTLHPAGGKNALAAGQTYYGGITIGEGWFELDENKLAGLAPGRYRLVVYNNETKDRAQRVFRIAGTVGFWSVAGKTGDANLAVNPAAEALVGALIPFEIANKADDMIDTEEEAFFQLIIPPGLTVYYDSLKNQKVTSSEVIETEMGVRKLWASGSSAALSDSTYGVMIRGNRDTLHLNFYLPSLAFVDSLNFDKDAFVATDLLGDPKPQLGDGFSAVFYPTWLIAFDSRTGEICHVCNDIITVETEHKLSFRNAGDNDELKLENGRLKLMVKGDARVENGSFTVTAASPAVTTNWQPINLEPPPVPLIDSAAMFDADGDGAADSLVIWYDRNITMADSTPDSLIIVWPLGSTDTITVKGKDEILSHVIGTNVFSLSREFTTSPLTGAIGEVKSASTFSRNGRDHHLAIDGVIADRMPPILLSANLKIASSKNVGVSAFDTLIVTFTEAVDSTGLGNLAPFEYILLSESGLTPVQVNPFVTLWAADMHSVELRFRPDEIHPRMGDSVRILVAESIYVLADKRGNLARANNPFVVIEGAKRSEVSKITLTEMDPGAIMERWDGQEPTFIAPVGMYEEFSTTKDKLIDEYGAILGHLVKIDMKTILSDSAVINQVRLKKGLNYQLSKDDVKLVIKTQYYTNLGAYVAGSEREIGCNDEVYKGDCTGPANANIFVGWNLRSDNQRVLGSGAYVARLQAYVVVDGIGKLKSTELEDRSVWGLVRKHGATGHIAN